MKKLLLANLAFIIFGSVQGQERDRLISIAVGGGLHQLRYQLNEGSRKGLAGFSVSAGYSIFLNKRWGVASGIGVHSLRSQSTMNYMLAIPDVDSDGDRYELRTYYKEWKEEQKALLIDIPFSVIFRHMLNQKIGLNAHAGAMISIPVSATYTGIGGTIVTTGYYSQWNVELGDLPEQGFYTYAGRPHGDLSLKPVVSLGSSLGITYRLTESINIYTDAYACYGLNSMLKSSNKPILQKDGSYNGLLTSNEAGKIRASTLGIMLGVSWSMRQ